MLFAQEKLEAVKIIAYEIFPNYAVLKLKGKVRRHTIKLTEVIDEKQRKYSYYLLLRDKVVRGFDNAADPRVLKLKWGPKYKDHLNEFVPHMHTEDKKDFILTEEVSFEDVVKDFKQLLSKRS